MGRKRKTKQALEGKQAYAKHPHSRHNTVEKRAKLAIVEAGLKQVRGNLTFIQLLTD